MLSEIRSHQPISTDNAAVNLGASLEAEIDDSLVAVRKSHPGVRMEENDSPIIHNVNLLPNVRMEVDLSDESEGDMEAMRREIRERLAREEVVSEGLTREYSKRLAREVEGFEGLARGWA